MAGHIVGMNVPIDYMSVDKFAAQMLLCVIGVHGFKRK